MGTVADILKSKIKDHVVASAQNVGADTLRPQGYPKEAASVQSIPGRETTSNGDIPGLTEIEIESKKRAQAVVASALASLDVRIDQYGIAQLVISENDRMDTMPLESQAATDTIQYMLTQRGAKTIGRDTLERELSVARATAVRANKRIDIHKRTAMDNGGILIDLGDTEGRVIRVSDGVWDTEHNTTVAFRRGNNYGSLPVPLCPNNTTQALKWSMEGLVALGIPKEHVLVVIALLLEYWRPNTPLPVLELLGMAGSWKTSVAEGLISFIDPTTSGHPTETKLTQEDLAAVTQVTLAVLIDNASKLSPDIQDLLCKAVFGSDVGGRKYYEQGTAIILHIFVAVIITAITPVITRGDLLDRTIRLQLPVRTDYRSSDDIKSQIDEIKPRMLGGLCTLLAVSLQKIPEVKAQRQWTHRLVDFMQLGEALAQSIGMVPGSFINKFDKMRKESAAELAKGDNFLIELRKLLASMGVAAIEQDEPPSARNWFNGSKAPGYYAIRTRTRYIVGLKPSELLRRTTKLTYNGAGRDDMPRDERALDSWVTRRADVLKSLGIMAERKAVYGARNAWVFEFSDLAAVDEDADE